VFNFFCGTICVKTILNIKFILINFFKQPNYLSTMKRNRELIEKRKEFVTNYVTDNQSKQMKVIVNELTEMLFLSERTIYNILTDDQNGY